MHIKLAYGHEQVPIDVPDNWINGRCYRPRPVEQCADARAELIAALQNVAEPFDLEKLCQGRKECVIAVDAEAPAVMEDVLPELVDQIEEVGGITASAITILLTNSAVAPRHKDELIALVPEDLRRRHRVDAHDPLDGENVRTFGKSPMGVDLALNAIYCSADLKVILGGVRPDLILGFSGGRSVVAPGLMSQESAKSFFSPENLADKNSRYGNYRDNPFHKAGLEAVAAAGCDLGVSVTLTPVGAVNRVFLGHFGQSHLAAMNHLLESMKVNVREPMDIVVTSGGGAPHDRTLADLLVTLSAVQSVLKPDGTIVIAAALENGIGPEEFQGILSNHDNVKDGMRALSGGNGLNMHAWMAQRLYAILQEHEIILFNTSLQEDLLWQTGMTPSRDMNEAVLGAMESHGQRCKIVALPEGPMGIGEIGAR